MGKMDGSCGHGDRGGQPIGFPPRANTIPDRYDEYDLPRREALQVGAIILPAQQSDGRGSHAADCENGRVF